MKGRQEIQNFGRKEKALEEQSLLNSVKESIGINTADEGFDADLTLTIDGFLSDLNQVGCGVSTIEDDGKVIVPRIRNLQSLTWNQFFGPVRNPGEDEAIKYVRLKTKLMFDPPLPATIKWYEDAALEALIRTRNDYDV